MNLKIAKCCGSCMHVNKPKTPEGHVPHYEVSKTERWCFKNNIPTMREAVCSDYLFNEKGTAKRNFGRIKGQNERLEKIIEISEFMKANNIKQIKGSGSCIFFIHNDRLKYKYGEDKCERYYYTVSCKDSLRDLLEVYEERKSSLVGIPDPL